MGQNLHHELTAIAELGMLPPLGQITVLPTRPGLAVKPGAAFMKNSTPLVNPSLNRLDSLGNAVSE